MPAPADPYRPHVGVHLILTEGSKVLLLRRANTGFADGSWSLPGGSLENGETLPAAAALFPPPLKRKRPESALLTRSTW